MTTMWSAGEPARAAGVTVRTLHHYDEIDLLVPGERTATGHRRYTADDVRRLHRIRALRHLGVPLDRIAAALDTGDLRAVLTARLHDHGWTARDVPVDDVADRYHRPLPHPRLIQAPRQPTPAGFTTATKG